MKKSFPKSKNFCKKNSRNGVIFYRTGSFLRKIIYSTCTKKLFVFFAGKHNVRKYSKNKCARNCSDFNSTKAYDHSAYARNENHGSNKQVFVLVQVYLLEHLEAGNLSLIHI